MAEQHPRVLWMNAHFVPYEDAKVHVLSTAVKYAASVYEGIRAYWNEEGRQLYVFRLPEHLRRLEESAEIARIPLPYSQGELQEHLLDVIRHNDLHEDLHVRLLASVLADNGRIDSQEPVGVTIATMPMGRYHGREDAGLRACISSWARISDAAVPPRVKTVANYHNSRLALLEAKMHGYDDAILLNDRGKLTEGPGYNLFVVRHGEVLTPPVTSNILEGVTRHTLIRLFDESHGVRVHERDIDRTELYVADEAFFCGSGKEVVPILSVDGHKLGGGTNGPWTATIRSTYFNVARGKVDRYREWLSPVY